MSTGTYAARRYESSGFARTTSRGAAFALIACSSRASGAVAFNDGWITNPKDKVPLLGIRSAYGKNWAVRVRRR